ncbi:MAG: type secretion protein EsxA [Symbiobacteriaceae bacterium]|jgi:WXG100 family type VII secretion target|nr:type secretion protein EsxA [Symbiobacteriaceae bacterium]
MAKILISPEEILALGNQFRSASSRSQDIVAEMNNAMSDADSKWDGMTANDFFLAYEQWKKDMAAHVELLRQIGDDLEVIARRFAEADRQSI